LGLLAKCLAPDLELFPVRYTETTHCKKTVLAAAAPMEREQAPQFPYLFSSAGSVRRHSTAWAWQAIPILEHIVFPASRRQVTQRSVHSAHPGGCAWTAGSLAGRGGLAGAFGTVSADGNVGSAEQFAHGGGGSAARATTIVMTATAITSEPQRMGS
jgi:hypothetical protein